MNEKNNYSSDEEVIKIIKAKMCSNTPYIVAIDGECGSGKTFLSEKIASECNGSVIHMDDFFVPPALRDEAHLEVRIHYERFIDEIIPNLKSGNAFSYRHFSCETMDYDTDIEFIPSKLIVIEGSYCLAPQLGRYYDFSIYSYCEYEERIRRLSDRCKSEPYLQRFINEWIPAETAYENRYRISDNADLMLNRTNAILSL